MEPSTAKRGHDVADSPLDAWKFLVGEWRGTAKDQFGETGVIEDVAVFSLEPSERFITTRGEGWCEGRLLNRSLAVMFHDKAAGRFRRETFFSYGFVNHETQIDSPEGELRFEIAMEPNPKEFAGQRWRSFLRRISDDEIATGLEVSKGDGPFERYGEVRLHRVR